jgi:hypothetical protein
MSAKYSEAVEKLKKEKDADFKEGYDSAIDLIMNDRMDLAEVELYSTYDSLDYISIRKAKGYYDVSNTFLKGFIQACVDMMIELKDV